MNDLYTKLNNQIQNTCIEQLKMIKANDLNTNQIDTLREQYQLLLKQIQYKFIFIIFLVNLSIYLDYVDVNLFVIYIQWKRLKYYKKSSRNANFGFNF
jgi:hypothetical protein